MELSFDGVKSFGGGSVFFLCFKFLGSVGAGFVGSVLRMCCDTFVVSFGFVRDDG